MSTTFQNLGSGSDWSGTELGSDKLLSVSEPWCPLLGREMQIRGYKSDLLGEGELPLLLILPRGLLGTSDKEHILTTLISANSVLILLYLPHSLHLYHPPSLLSFLPPSLPPALPPSLMKSWEKYNKTNVFLDLANVNFLRDLNLDLRSIIYWLCDFR